MDTINYYDVLRVKSDASETEIKHAYKKLAQLYHPDKRENQKFANHKMKQLNEAYATLSDPIKRSEYDAACNSFDQEAEVDDEYQEARGDSGAIETRSRAENGDVDAMYDLGEMYYFGTNDLVQDYTRSSIWFRLAADQGHPSAQYSLGWMYYYGQGVLEDGAESAKWHRRAAKQGYAESQYWLADMYKNGIGVVQDYDKSVEFYILAAEQEHAESQQQLGECYEQGISVPKDYIQAYFWYSQSATQDNKDAKSSRAKLRKRMTRVQVAEAKRMASVWQPKTE